MFLVSTIHGWIAFVIHDHESQSSISPKRQEQHHGFQVEDTHVVGFFFPILYMQ